ncbi:hypothetical protein GF325_01380 [Candidatus Bathyarchaeota archaeon]|nr:hypothetical protein [Candidatus Bathyarchaeota archaeon]
MKKIERLSILLVVLVSSCAGLASGVYLAIKGAFIEEAYTFSRHIGTNGSISINVPLEGNHEYEVFFHIQDYDMSVAETSADCEIWFNGSLVQSDELYSIDYSEGGFEGITASDFMKWKHFFPEGGILLVDALIDADRWRLEIYQDKPRFPNLFLTLGSWIIIVSVGFLAYVYSSWKAMKAA